MTARARGGRAGLARAARAGGAALALQWREAPVVSGLALALTVATGAVAAPAAWLTRDLIDELSRGAAADRGHAVGLAIGAALLAGLATAILHTSHYLAIRLRWRVARAAERDLFGRVIELDGLAPFEDPAFHGRLRLAEQAAREAPSQIAELINTAVRASVAIVTLVGVVYVVWPPMTLLLLAVGGLGLVAQIARGRAGAAAAEDMIQTHRWRDYYRGLLIDARPAKEIRLLGLGRLFLDRALAGLERAARRDTAVEGRGAAIQAAIAIVGAGVTAVGSALVVGRALDGRLAVGDVVLFLAAVAGMQAAITGLVLQIGDGGSNLVLFENYLAIVGTPVPAVCGAEPPPLTSGIELRDVWFRYSPTGPWILRGVDLWIPHGRAIGLVGINGAGKSTLVKLLTRLYDPERGQILWDGIDLRELDPRALRRRLATTLQDFMTYDLSAQENVGLGDLPALDDETGVRAAAALAEIDSTLAALPHGYRTVLSRSLAGDAEGGAGAPVGVTLSGGQWQRVALARSLVRQGADLLILDEPSSGLDAAAEHQIHRTLDRSSVGRTRLLISHRLSALRAADRIAVLIDGSIAEQGCHDELMVRRGAYARLFALQARGYQDARVDAPALEDVA